jgi:hypothetical protein
MPAAGSAAPGSGRPRPGRSAAGAGGQYGIALTARDAAGSGAQLLTVTVDQAPQFTSHPAIAASTAAASSTAATITGYPAAVITGTARETISLSVSNPAYVPPAPPVMMAPAPVMSAPPVMMPPG